MLLTISDCVTNIDWFCCCIGQSDGPSWSVPTGRRDGRVSLQSKVLPNLPSPFDSVAVQLQKFDDKGLDDHDLVTLVGKAFYSSPIYVNCKVSVISRLYIKYNPTNYHMCIFITN